jgi:hypothetical protein
MSNPWVDHVRKVAKDNNIGYMCAITKAKETYVPPVKVSKRALMSEKEKKDLERLSKDVMRGENQDLYDRLQHKISKREDRKKQYLSDKIALKNALKEANLTSLKSPYENYTIDALKKQIELIKKEPERFVPFYDKNNEKDINLVQMEVKKLDDILIRKLRFEKYKKYSVSEIKAEINAIHENPKKFKESSELLSYLNNLLKKKEKK